MRLVALLVILLLAAGAALAQDDPAAGGDGAAGNNTATDGADGNATEDGGEETPQPTGPVRITLVGHADSGFYWTSPDHPGRNPRIQIPPGAEVIVTAQQAEGETTPHNLKVGAQPASEIFSEPGSSITYTFTAPESGSLVYICVIHGTPMSGTFVVQGAGGGGDAGGGGENDTINGATVRLKDVFPSAQCDRDIPAVATRDTVGGKTLADYAADCVQSADSGEPTDHPVDLLLPLSWLLIGLGVVGVVWVHKYYKP